MGLAYIIVLEAFASDHRLQMSIGKVSINRVEETSLPG